MSLVPVAALRGSRGVLTDHTLERRFRHESLRRLRNNARLLLLVLGACKAIALGGNLLDASAFPAAPGSELSDVVALMGCAFAIGLITRTHTWPRAAAVLVASALGFLALTTIDILTGRTNPPIALSLALAVVAVLYLSAQLTTVLTAALGVTWTITVIAAVLARWSMTPMGAGSADPAPGGVHGFDWGMLSVMSLLLVVVNVVGAVACHRSALSERSLFLQREEAELASATDSLTGMANRRRWEAELEAAWRGCVLRREPFSLLLIDVDHFKAVNDTLGHAAGDAVLMDLAAALASAPCRSSDLAARLGGDEFAVMLPGGDAQAVTRVAAVVQAEFRARTARLLGIAGVEQPTVSVGALTVDHPLPGEVDAAVRAADELLYRAKGDGRDRVVTGGLQAVSRGGAPVQRQVIAHIPRMRS